MHTREVLTSADFAFTVGGHEASLEDIFPGFDERDRIGVVVRSPGGGTGASSLLLAAITRFYDFHRSRLGNERGSLRIYPEYFVFHVGARHGDHRQIDVWPPHREVVVEEDPEQILEAINDRGVTRQQRFSGRRSAAPKGGSLVPWRTLRPDALMEPT